MTKSPRQTAPDVHKVLEAIRELEKDPVVRAYVALLTSLDSGWKERIRA